MEILLTFFLFVVALSYNNLTVKLGGSVAAMDVDASTKMSQTIGARSVSPSNNNNNASTNSLTSNISGSLKTSTTDRQQEDDDMDDEDDDDEMEDAFQTERGGLLLCPADPSASGPASSAASTTDISNVVSTRRRNSNAALSQTADKQSVPSAEDDFWGFAQPLLLPRGTANTNDGVMNINSSSHQSKTWQSQMLQWNLDKQQRQQQAAQKVEEEQAQQPKKRGRKKRKKEVPGGETFDNNEEDPIEWYAINIMGEEIATKESDISLDTKQEPKRQRVVANTTDDNNIDDLQGTHEERLHALQYLWLRHKGHSAAAKLETIVQLSAGNGAFSCKVCWLLWCFWCCFSLKEVGCCCHALGEMSI